jgi:hypothetical protein
MRTLWKWALVVTVPAMCMAADTPDEPLVPEGSTVPLLLLRQQSVQEELKLSADDVKKVMDFTNKQGKAAEEALTLGAEERRAKFDQLEREDREFLAATLNEGQRKRLDQITFQMTALTQLTRPEVVKALGLTEDQQKEIRQMVRQARRELVAILLAKDRENRHEEIAKLRAEAREKVMNLFTAEQKEKVKELVGEPFTGKIVFEKSEPGSKD